MDSLWVAKTGLDAQQTKMTVVSNNLANVSTNGYKRSRAVFEDLLYQTVRQPGAQNTQQNQIGSGLQLGTGVRMVATERIHTQGNLQQTGNALDMGVQGGGFFQVALPDGTPAYTRDGACQLDSQGQIVTASGYPLEPAIIIPNDAQSVTIGKDGAFREMAKGAIFIDNTTASAEVARELGEKADAQGFAFLDAPVSGGQAGAENGVLTVMVGGKEATYGPAEPVIKAYARMCKLLGPAGAGQLTKMVNQICIAGIVQGLSEGLSLARATSVQHFLVAQGIDETVLDVAGYGDEKPTASNDTPAGKARNRRVEIVLVGGE